MNQESIRFPSAKVKREAFHTFKLVRRHLSPGESVLDIGCGGGFLLAMLHANGHEDLAGVDIVDARRVEVPHFALFDGIHLDYCDDRFDVGVLSFVLHHVPNYRKQALIREAWRVVRRRLIVLEDTPVNWIDRLLNAIHGRLFRLSIGSPAPFGFYTLDEWEKFFRRERFHVRVRERLPRLCRDPLQPYARSLLVLEKTRGPVAFPYREALVAEGAR